MADRPTLEFLENQAGETEGLADAGVETYRDKPFAGCAREAGQNSRDAAKAKPVRIKFNVIRLSKDDIPARDILKEAIESCATEVKQERDQAFFANASKIIGAPEISVLEIADYNTTGLTGPPSETGTPFHSLVKASGVTVKEASNSGGSFGIGKNASFAVSDLRTVFYATTYLDCRDEEAFAAQGKIKLVSHKDSENVPRSATGYWGNAQFEAVTDRTQVPEWMNREEIGTSIFCLGFREAEDWRERMVYSLVSNFFCAIHRKEMEFEVDRKFSINCETLGDLLIRSSIKEAAEKAGYLERLEFARQLYRCLSSEATEVSELTIDGIGKMHVHILVEENMPCRVGFIRNGMLITDTLENFNAKLARFPGARDFIALVEPDPNDVDAGALLKNLENPAHDGFSAERITDEDKKEQVIAAMQELARKLREVINDSAEIKYEGATTIDELASYFPGAPGEGMSDDADGEPDPERYVYQARPFSPREPVVPDPDDDGEEGGSGGNGHTSGGGGGGHGPGHGKGSGGTGDMAKRQLVVLNDIRNTTVPDKPDSAQWRKLYFTPASSGHIELEILATGVYAPERLNLIELELEGVGEMKSGKLFLDVEEDCRLSLFVKFDEPYEGPIDMVAVVAETEEEGQSP